MSISSEITRIIGNIADAYDVVEAKGGAMPTTQNSENLPAAIESIPAGITPSGTVTLNANGTYDVTEKATAIVAIPVYDGSVT